MRTVFNLANFAVIELVEAYAINKISSTMHRKITEKETQLLLIRRNCFKYDFDVCKREITNASSKIEFFLSDKLSNR